MWKCSQTMSIIGSHVPQLEEKQDSVNMEIIYSLVSFIYVYLAYSTKLTFKTVPYQTNPGLLVKDGDGAIYRFIHRN